MEVFEILHKDSVAVDLKARSKTEALRELSKLAKRSPGLEKISEERVFEGLKKREDKGSTGVGNGVAVPHTPIEGLDRFVLALATSRRGVPFDALDKKKVHIFAVILGPVDKPKQHIELLAKISNVFRDETARHGFIKAESRLALYEDFMGRCRPESPRTGDRTKRRKVFIVVIQGEDVFQDVVQTLTELGVSGASIIKSHGLRSSLTGIPLFADFIDFFGAHSDESNTLIFTVYEDNVEDVVRAIEEITGDLDTHGGATIIAFEPWLIKGSLKLL
jgi:PTS system nitrogen regulatory IIA component